MKNTSFNLSQLSNTSISSAFENVVSEMIDNYQKEITINIDNAIREVANNVIGSENIRSDIQDMLGEDFSEFSSNVPSCFYFVGISNKEKETDYFHHHPRFNIDEDSLSIGVEMHIRTALEFLKN